MRPRNFALLKSTSPRENFGRSKSTLPRAATASITRRSVVAARSGVADGGEPGHVVPLDGAVHRRLEGLQVGDIDVVDVDAFLGQQGRQLAQRFLGQAGLDLDLRRPRAPGCRPVRLAVIVLRQRGSQQGSRGVPAEGLARPVVEFGSHGGQQAEAMHPQVAATGERLAAGDFEGGKAGAITVLGSSDSPSSRCGEQPTN